MEKASFEEDSEMWSPFPIFLYTFFFVARSGQSAGGVGGGVGKEITRKYIHTHTQKGKHKLPIRCDAISGI